MIKHVVLLRAGAAVEPVLKELEAFCQGFAGVVSMEFGKNVSIEPQVNHGYNVGFIVEFADAAARDRYVDDPGHKAIGAKLVAACPSGLADVLVFDLQC